MSGPEYENIADEPHTLRVLKYRPETGEHECRFDDHRSDVLGSVVVDLMVDGGLRGMNPYELVGKLVEVEYAYPYTYIAVGGRVVAGKSERL